MTWIIQKPGSWPYVSEMVLRQKPLLRSILIGVLLLVASPNWAYLQAAEDHIPDDVFLGYSAEALLHSRYRTLPNHKAMAIGPGATWSARGLRYTKESAANAVLEACARFLSKSRFKSLRKRKCYLYAIDDEIVFKGKPPKLPIGSVLPGKDAPLAKALYDRPPKGAERAIILHLHGCGRPRSVSRWLNKWFRYFRSKGFRVIMPKSFAERRPPSHCGQVKQLKRIPLSSRIMRFRAAQTKRTLRVLRQRYPNLPIILWGHSQGGVVAQLISDELAGVLVTGVACGVLDTRASLVRMNVPFLALIGSKDPFIRSPKSLTRQKVARYCKAALHPPEWDFVYLKGVGHFPSIRSRKARKAVDKFIARSFELHGR